MEYNRNAYKAFLALSLTSYAYQRHDPGKYGTFSDQSQFPSDQVTTPWQGFTPWSIKAGFNYRIAQQHHLFINGGYVTRAPMMDNIFTNNTPIARPITEKIGTVEIGYGWDTPRFHLLLNGYYTLWMDKSVTKAIGSWSGPRACIPNVDARHRGVELEASYRPFEVLRLNGFLSIGDWRWRNDVHFTLLDEQQQKVGDYDAYIKNLHVGNAPQTSLMLSATFTPLPNLSMDLNYNYYARYYADFTCTDRTKAEDRSDSWKLPNYATVDLNLCYGFHIGTIQAEAIGNVYNLFNKHYICDALDGSDHSASTALVWYGFGLTWSAGLRLRF